VEHRQIARVIDAMRAEGEAIPDDMLPFLSPLGWQHINLTGDYIWAAGSAAPKAQAAAQESENASVAA
jgi:hypothetical protein